MKGLDAAVVMKIVDSSGDGQISFNEWIAYLVKIEAITIQKKS